MKAFKYFVALMLLINVAMQAQYVTIDGKQFVDSAGNPFYLKMMNYNAQLVCNSWSNPTEFKAIRNMQYGTTNCFLEPVSRYSWSNCDSSVTDDFRKLKQMGFNGVRFLLPPNRRNTTAQPGGFRISAKEFDNSAGMCDTLRHYDLNIGPGNYGTDTNAQKYFNVILHILDLAYNEGLNVIIFFAGHSGSYYDINGNLIAYPEMASSTADAADYADYIQSFSSAVNNSSGPGKYALMGYDLYPEPNFSWYVDGKNMCRKKDTICSYVSEWYDASKAGDPHHLVTLSGTSNDDVLVWDEGVMKLDFASMHLYPYGNTPIAPGGGTRNVDKVKDMITWCSNELQIPWIVGETGYSAADDSCLFYPHPYVWGSYTDQYNYFNYIFPQMRNCGASGYSLWTFQDIHWYCVSDSICPNSCAYCDNWNGWCGKDSQYNFDPEKFHKNADPLFQNYFGFIKYGDPDTTGHYPDSLDKPVVTLINSFDSVALGNCPDPTAYYYNPYDHPPDPMYQGFPTTIHGHIIDQDGQPIKDAYINAHTPIKINPEYPFNLITDVHYTYSDANGDFTLIPYDYAPSQFDIPNTNNIAWMLISAYASDIAERNSGDTSMWNPQAIAIHDNDTIVLKRMVYNYDVAVNGATVTGGDSQNFQGYGTLTADSVTVEASATAEFKARTEVHITGESHFAAGSEVHLYCAATFNDCSSFGDFRGRSQPFIAADNNEPGRKTFAELEMQFLKQTPTLDFVILPNPNKGKFVLAVKITGTDETNTDLTIYNLMGTIVYAKHLTSNNNSIELNGFAPGIYYISLKNTLQTVNKKLIIQ